MSRSLTQKLKRLFRPKREITLDPISAYDKIAQTYDQQGFNLLHELDALVLDELLNSIRPFEKVLDYGAGTGRNLSRLSERSPSKIFAFEPSKEMLAILKRKHPNVTVLLSNEGSKALAADSLDFINCSLCLSYIERLENFFVEMNRILLPKGSLSISTLHPSMNTKKSNRHFDVDGEKIIINHSRHSQEQILKAIQEAGLVLISEKAIRIDEPLAHLFPKKESYKSLRGREVLQHYLIRKP